jgi:serine/threonine protein phosphatase 1
VNAVITFIGDVHGYIDRLDSVLHQSRGDVVFVGDLVDRGPDVRAAVQRVRELEAAGQARCLMGNHEYALVRSVGVPELDIPPCPPLFESWFLFYGGDATVASYGAIPEPASIRAAMGDDLLWLAQRPWVLQGRLDARRWIAVHAGLSPEPLAQQLEALEHPEQWWRADADLPMELYCKEWVDTVPCDLPDDCCVISGHVPLEECYITPERIVCDTSGGLHGRVLSAVVWPEELVIVSDGLRG